MKYPCSDGVDRDKAIDLMLDLYERKQRHLRIKKDADRFVYETERQMGAINFHQLGAAGWEVFQNALKGKT